MMDIGEELKIFDDEIISQINKAAKNKVEYWDVRAAVREGNSIEFTDQKSKEVSSYNISECGIRSFINGGWGFSVLHDLSKASVYDAFQQSAKLAKLSEKLTKNKFKIKEREGLEDKFILNPKISLEDTSIEAKIDLLKDHESRAADYSSLIKNTRSFYMDATSKSIFLNSFGSNISQQSSVVRIFSLVYAQKNGVLQKAINSIGGLGGFEITQTDEAQGLSNKSAKEAVELLDAQSPVGGKFTIIMDPKLNGTFIHEAFGHAVEADLILNKESILAEKIGEQVATEAVTIKDDPRMGQGKKFNLPYELFGSYYVDSEGIPAQETVIIEKGVLKNYLHSLETSSRMDVGPNGHGRASNSTNRPQVRMGITTLESGEWDLDEMIADTDSGILCEDFQYGYTDPTTGNFQFKCKLSYKIEKGEKKEMMRDVALSGMTLEVLNRISAIGNQIHYSDGMCGKGGQSVRVCDGGPFIRIEDVMVGGLN